MPAPTIGRVIYYRPSPLDLMDASITVLDLNQPLRADVCFVSDDGSLVNLSVTDHTGRTFQRSNVLFFDEQLAAHDTAHAHWMPYQLAQAAAGQPVPTPVV